jgi:hypothetical protein
MEIATDIWVYALIRRVEQGGAFATVARKGDARSGAVLVKCFDRLAGETRLFSQAIRADGNLTWMQPLDSLIETDADAYADRAARIDPDLWVVEIEAHDGARFLTEPVARD